MYSPATEAIFEVHEELFGLPVLVTPELSRQVAERIYGRPVSRQTWQRWQKRVLASSDLHRFGGFRAGSHLLLCALAFLSRGNGPRERVRKVPREAIAAIARRALDSEKAIGGSLPEQISYQELRQMVESRALRSYSDRHHRRQGLMRSRKAYSRAEAIAILNQYPNFLEEFYE